METFLTIVYVLVCLFLITVVLLQSGKGGMGSAFGGAGSSNTVFGGAGAGNFLTKLTAVCAALFMILSATLAYMSSSSDGALRRAAEAEAEKEAAKAALLETPTKPNTEPAEDTDPTSLEIGVDSEEGALDVVDDSDRNEATEGPAPTEGAGVEEEATVAPTEGAAPTEAVQDLPADPATP